MSSPYFSKIPRKKRGEDLEPEQKEARREEREVEAAVGGRSFKIFKMHLDCV